MDARDRLSADHTPEAIARRVAAATQHSYLGDGVLGAIDGTVTTFAIVAAAAGAGFSGAVALVFGFANVLADGFSMAVSNYLRSKSDRQVVERARAMEEHHIETIPEGEREEIRHVFAAKGFEGKILDEIVEVIPGSPRSWGSRSRPPCRCAQASRRSSLSWSRASSRWPRCGLSAAPVFSPARSRRPRRSSPWV
jgi:hypothetical protein